MGDEVPRGRQVFFLSSSVVLVLPQHVAVDSGLWSDVFGSSEVEELDNVVVEVEVVVVHRWFWVFNNAFAVV